MDDAVARPDLGGDDLAVALALADAADVVTRARFGAADLHVATKPDLTPVTDADREVERRIRALLAEWRPADGVLGEELGETTGTATARRWVLDPIDATKNFVRGVPVWATLVALEEDGRVTTGVVSAPALGRRWWAAEGRGAYADHRRLAVSAVGELADASLSYSSLSGWRQLGLLERFLELEAAVWRSRAYGDFWSYLLLAEGALDIACEPEVSRWDLAAVSVVVQEAGGRFTSLAGEPGPGAGNAVATNGRLHEQVLRRLTAARADPGPDRAGPAAGG